MMQQAVFYLFGPIGLWAYYGFAFLGAAVLARMLWAAITE
jgi:hypothetical protein